MEIQPSTPSRYIRTGRLNRIMVSHVPLSRLRRGGSPAPGDCELRRANRKAFFCYNYHRLFLQTVMGTIVHVTRTCLVICKCFQMLHLFHSLFSFHEVREKALEGKEQDRAGTIQIHSTRENGRSTKTLRSERMIP